MLDQEPLMASANGNGGSARSDANEAEYAAKVARLDPVRRLIIQRAGQLGFALADLSRHVERNDTYIHQFIWRGSPVRLPEEIREPLAQILQVPEEQLKPTATTKPTPATVYAPGRMTPSPALTPLQSAGGDVPLFRDTDAIEPARATEWAGRPLAMGSSGSGFAVWITRPHGRRLSHGDMAFVHPSQPPKIGDPVVLLRGTEIIGIGDLTDISDDHCTIVGTKAEKKRIDLSGGVSLLKIVTINLA